MHRSAIHFLALSFTLTALAVSCGRNAFPNGPIVGTPTPTFTAPYLFSPTPSGAGTGETWTPTATPIVPTATWTPTFSPTLSPTSTPFRTPTLSMTAPPTGIAWDWAYVTSFDGTTCHASMRLAVNGVPETTANVYLTTPQGPVTLLYHASTWPGYASYELSRSLVYQPGFAYTLTTDTSIGTAFATVTAPGGNAQLSSDGTTVTWDVEGNADYVTVYCPESSMSFATNMATADISSPFRIPGAPFTTAGTYNYRFVQETFENSVTGATPGSFFNVGNDISRTIKR